MTEFDPLVIKFMGSLCGWGQIQESVHNNIAKELKDWFKNLDAHLKDKTYLVGNSLTIADIAVATYVHYAWRLFYDEKTRGGFPQVGRWFAQVSSIPAFRNVMGPTWGCQEPYQPVFANQEEKVEEKKEEKKGK